MEAQSVLVMLLLSPVSSEQATTVTKDSRNSRQLFGKLSGRVHVSSLDLCPGTGHSPTSPRHLFPVVTAKVVVNTGWGCFGRGWGLSITGVQVTQIGTDVDLRAPI